MKLLKYLKLNIPDLKRLEKFSGNLTSLHGPYWYSIAQVEKLSAIPHFCMCVLVGIFCITHLLFIAKTQANLGLDKAIWSHIVNRLNTTDTNIPVDIGDIKKRKKREKKKPSDIFWILLQLAGTLILAAIFLFMYYSHK